MSFASSNTLTAAMISATCLATPALAKDKSFDFSGFNEVEISAGLDAEIVEGPFEVRAEGGWFRMKNLEIRQEGDRLIVTQEGKFLSLASHIGKSPKIHVQLPELDELVVMAGVTVEVAHQGAPEMGILIGAGADVEISGLKVETLELEVAAGSDAELSGDCGDLTARASAGSSIKADKLLCKTAALRANAGSSIKAYASDTAKANALIGADIRISGGAEVEASEGLGGDVH